MFSQGGMARLGLTGGVTRVGVVWAKQTSGHYLGTK
jgi:hypothetical protein